MRVRVAGKTLPHCRTCSGGSASSASKCSAEGVKGACATARGRIDSDPEAGREGWDGGDAGKPRDCSLACREPTDAPT